MINKILFAVLIFINLNALAQEEEITSNVISVNHSTKSDRQKSAAWILLGTGTVSALGGILIMNNDNSNNEKNFGYGDSFNSEGFLILGGVLCAVVSIPFFVSANRNKEKAKQTTAKFKIEKLDNHISLNENKCYPSLSLSVKILKLRFFG